MPSEVFELLAQGFRYWFVLLGLVIVWRAFRWAMQEHRAYRRVMKALPDAGLIGEIVNLQTGASQPLPREGVIGAGKACDVRLPGIRSRELEYAFVEKRGIEIIPAHRQHELKLNGQDLGDKGYASHGSRLNVPGYALRFRLFSGLNVPELQHHEPEEQAATLYDPFDELEQAGMPLPEQLPGLNEYHMPQHSASFVHEDQQPMEELVYQYGEQHPDAPASIAQDYSIPVRDWNPDLTWQYAVPPPEAFEETTPDSYQHPAQPVWEQEYQQEASQPRKRRSKRHEN